jgi:thymidylate synthase (FAD)
MIIVEPKATVLYPDTDKAWVKSFKRIEYAGRTAYKSQMKRDVLSHEDFIRKIIKSGHESVIEHGTMTILVSSTDRGISHELVRHRLMSPTQESTRYCNYAKGDMEFVLPSGIEPDSALYTIWREAMAYARKAYNDMIALGASPQKARSVLPHSLKTTCVLTANYREWRHIFALRVLGKAGNPHPDIKALLEPVYKKLVSKYPFLWAIH